MTGLKLVPAELQHGNEIGRICFEAIKVMNLMAMGSYEPPDEVWMSSILY